MAFTECYVAWTINLKTKIMKTLRAIWLTLRLWGTLGYGRELGKHTFFEWIYESRLGLRTSWNVSKGIHLGWKQNHNYSDWPESQKYELNEEEKDVIDKAYDSLIIKMKNEK